MPFYNKYLMETDSSKKKKKKRKKYRHGKLQKVRRSKRKKESMDTPLIPRLKGVSREVFKTLFPRYTLKKKIQKNTPYQYDFSTKYRIGGGQYSLLEVYNMESRLLPLIEKEINKVFSNALEEIPSVLLICRREYEKIFSVLEKLDDLKWIRLKNIIDRNIDEYIERRIRYEMYYLKKHKFHQTKFHKKTNPLLELVEIISNKTQRINLREEISQVKDQFVHITDPISLLRFHLGEFREELKASLTQEEKNLIETPEDHNIKRRLKNYRIMVKTVRKVISLLSNYTSNNYLLVLNKILRSQTLQFKVELKKLSLFMEQFEIKQFESLFERCKEDPALLTSTTEIYEQNLSRTLETDAAYFFGLSEILNDHLSKLRAKKYPNQKEEIKRIQIYKKTRSNWEDDPKEIFLRLDRINPYRKPIPELKDTIFKVFKSIRRRMKHEEATHQYHSASVHGSQIVTYLKRYNDIYNFSTKIYTISLDIRRCERILDRWKH